MAMAAASIRFNSTFTSIYDKTTGVRVHPVAFFPRSHSFFLSFFPFLVVLNWTRPFVCTPSPHITAFQSLERVRTFPDH